MSEGDRRREAGQAATLPGVGDGTAISIDHGAVGQAATMPAASAPGMPHAPTLPGPHTVADHASLQPVPEHSYSIGDEIARGGMGKILSARDRRLRRDVVIKVTRHEDGRIDPRFEREALITARLQHPSIVRVYEAGVLDDGRAFYAMERVRGESLEVVLERTHSLRERLSLLPHAIAVSDAIAYAHNEGVLHRDLKPSNVLIGPFGETVVIDWGLAKDLRAGEVAGALSSSPGTSSSDASLTQVGSVMGTPSYMAPEQARGDASDERTDVYALGALLYTLLSGVPPHRGRTTEEVLEQVAAGRRVPIAEREPTVPPELATIVERAMARAPADRYANAKDLADELRLFTAGKLVASHTYSIWRLLKRWVRRHAISVGVAAFAVVVLAVVGVLAFYSVVQERDKAQEAERDAQDARAIAERNMDDLKIDQAAGAIDADPSRAVAWIGLLSDEALEWPKTRTLVEDAAARGLARELRGHTSDIEVITLSPDGKRLATASDDGTIRMWTIADESSLVLTGHDGPIETLAFSPDGTTLASGGSDGIVFLWRGAVGRKLEGHGDTVRAVAFSPDGAQLASTSEDGTLFRWDVGTGARTLVVKHTHGLRPIVWTRDAIVVGGFDGRIGHFDPRSGQGSMQPAHKAEVRSLAVSPDGAYVAAGDETGVVRLWTVGGALAAELGRHTDVVRDLVFTPSGTRLVSAGGDSVVLVHPIPSGAPIELRGNAEGVKDVAVSADGAWVATAGIDGTVQVWPIGGGEPRAFRGHGHQVKGVVFAPGGRLISGAEDDRARIWRLDALDPPPAGTALRAWITTHTNVGVRAPRAPR